MLFDPQLDIRFDAASFTFEYGPGVFGPAPEMRRLGEIRPSLQDPGCDGPDPVYAIAMDVGLCTDREEITKRGILFAAVAYARGSLGRELVRSQGHVHSISPGCGVSTPELVEVWQGNAIVYMQEKTDSEPGRCFAIQAVAGQKVIIPPAWAHCIINADPEACMVFGACCVRDYAFEYNAVRAHGGLAWYPLWHQGQIRWEQNRSYLCSPLRFVAPHDYPSLRVLQEVPMYQQFSENPESLQWIANPETAAPLWECFQP